MKVIFLTSLFSLLTACGSTIEKNSVARKTASEGITFGDCGKASKYEVVCKKGSDDLKIWKCGSQLTENDSSTIYAQRSENGTVTNISPVQRDDLSNSVSHVFNYSIFDRKKYLVITGGEIGIIGRDCNKKNKSETQLMECVDFDSCEEK